MTSSFSDENQLEREGAKLELARRGIPYAEEHFLRHIRSGNCNVVTLYLRAGISPDATLDGESALAVSANHGHKPISKLLLDAGADLGCLKTPFLGQFLCPFFGPRGIALNRCRYWT